MPDDGGIAGDGSHEELIEKGGLFDQPAERQLPGSDGKPEEKESRTDRKTCAPGLRRERGGYEMQFIIRAYDGPDMLEKRMAVRPRHLENMTKVDGRTVCAGGLLDAEGKMKGSVLILEFDAPEKLDAYLASEPYIVERVWEKIEVEPINVVVLDGRKVGR